MTVLRKATQADADTIAQIHRIARASAMPWLPVVHTPKEDLDYFSNTVIAVQHVRVAESEGQIFGFSATADDWLNHLYIHPDQWRRGTGGLLLNDALSHKSYLQLWTFQQNLSARTFYGAHGFEEVELTDGSGNEEKTPDVRMVWTRT